MCDDMLDHHLSEAPVCAAQELQLVNTVDESPKAPGVVNAHQRLGLQAEALSQHQVFVLFSILSIGI